MPTQKEMSILVATGYTMKVIDSPEVQKMVLVAKGMANDWMDEKLKKNRSEKSSPLGSFFHSDYRLVHLEYVAS